ncbi:polysaccharide deacetylase family protein [Neorhodopirellula pilleata]|uniref:Polysaccharide deacetylase n=1 Tax=Neorhodopirellula pilleata TaxID=2714738 RepID=A0A5C6AWN3_9BACT|nr:polysaccharide deacetylase family protein [Neorhodopirellula pilleata]TWU03559.1 Polysaccharide deacetylase [Neorhodopirellula pilleata]
MNPVRTTALYLRYHSQRSLRKTRIDQLCARKEAPISVLFYHRVADTHPNSWTISKAGFQRSMDYCRENFEIISLAEVQRRIETRNSPRPAVAITFDDGYAENSQFALPYLIRHRIPCTYFVTTENIRHGRPFEHDLAQGQPLAVDTPELLRAAACGGIEIGLHTANHVDFNRVTKQEQLEHEIIDAKADLEAMIGGPVRYMAVPFGMPLQMRPAVFETARQCGLAGVCSAFGAYNLVGNDSFHIRRIHGDREFIRLKNWLTFDERKLKFEPALPFNDIIVNPPSAMNHSMQTSLIEPNAANQLDSSLA